MRFIDIHIFNINSTRLHFSKGEKCNPYESLRLTVHIRFSLTNKEAIAFATDVLSGEGLQWFLSGGYKWTLDLDRLKASVEVCNDLEWLSGRITVEPEYKLEEKTTYLVVTLMPEDLSRELFHKQISRTPEELLPSLSKFQRDYPNPMKNGFIIMQFSNSRAHQEILDSIRRTLKRFSMNGLRADEKEYSDELLTNIRTYMHGCGFGIAVFERLLEDDFNPNISLEVGYMMAQGKPVCFLKDKTLKSLHTDIVGKLYRDFNTQEPHETIPAQLEAWLRDKGLI